MLLGTPSLHYREAFTATFDWDSGSEEEFLAQEDRLRAGGSNYQNKRRQDSQNRPEGPKSYRKSGSARDELLCCGQKERTTENMSIKEERKVKTKKFAKLKKKMSIAKNSMLRQKKRQFCAMNTAILTERSEENMNVHPQNSVELNESLFCDNVQSPSKNKILKNQSLLIPDLNLKVTEASTYHADVKKDSHNELSNTSKEKGNRVSEKSVHVTVQESVLLFPVNLDVDNHQEHRKLKKVQLLNVPPQYSNVVEKKTKNTHSLPLLVGKSLQKDAREAKTTAPIKKRLSMPKLRRQIYTTCDYSLYNLDNVMSNCRSDMEKLTRSSILTKKEAIEKSGIFNDELEEKMSPWSRLPKDLISIVSQQSVRVRYPLKRGFNGDEGFWLRRNQSVKICEEKRSLLDIPVKTSASSFIPLVPEDHIESSGLRIYVLALFCAVTFMQSIVSSTWSSITDSVMFAYPDTKARSVSLLSHWGSLCLLISIIPACYLLHKKGLRTALLVACSLCTVGAGVRCLQVNPDHFILLAHVASILNGIGGVVYGPAIVMLSSTWFPANERTFATSVGTSLSMLGSATTYYLGPMIVSDPSAFSDELKNAKDEETYYNTVKGVIQEEIHAYLKCCFISQLCFFLLLLIFFPEKPKYPTSKASSMSLSLKIPCLESLKSIINNRQLVLLSISSAMINGVATPWLSLLSMTLTPLHISQSISAHIGFWTIICGCVMSLAVSKLSDWYPGYLKESLILFGFLSTIMFTWVALMIGQILPYTENKLLLAIMIGISSVWATSPLFYELGAEVAYPAPESIVTGLIFLVTNLTVAIFNAFLYFFHTSDVTWLSYTLALFSFSSTACLYLVRPVYKRSLMDLPKR